jgi:hypothetical protein
VKRDDFLHNGAAAAVSAPDFGFGGWYNDRSIIAALFFATDELRRRFAYFKLGAHFLICEVCSFRVAAKTFISFFCCTTVASSSYTLRCSFRNSLTNITAITPRCDDSTWRNGVIE